ncbi:DUF1090 domain-containing protein [Pectobacterium peruviense]|uniref:DUF1090 domain-containing protein n=1 Tax=Pectobacterium peruviense TaxID=2066479 RepID=A0ABX4S8T9_9GAMM|nr:DUF1090 domain-containing protein [Pectobacterium peruviense]KML70091.1 hypothetical protein G033_03215 [Pectobacterium peruviense]PKX82855.1 hypothetical protein A0G02_14095 [Pectobacterium peruviense]PKX86965.1 hypothetical protein A0G03_08660 [Pectobacterium peruviense]
MKLSPSVIALFILFSGHALANTSGQVETCQQKAQDIQRQIDEAHKHGNQNRINGLEKALEGVKTHCTDAGLAEKRQEAIAEKRKQVAERQQELSESRQKGDDADKILKRERKLAEAEQELRAAESSVSQ